MGIIAKLGDAVRGYRVGQRVIVGAITPWGQCFSCLSGDRAQCGGGTGHGHHHATGGWRFGNTIDGCQAEYLRETHPVEAIMELTGGRGVDVAIEALGLATTFENALRVLRPGGTLSSLGLYSGDLTIPLDAFAAGLGDKKIVSTLCPGGKERMRRLVDVIASRRLDLGDLVTHRYALDDITDAYELFANQRDGALKVAITA